jgi:hypothetical protein
MIRGREKWEPMAAELNEKFHGGREHRTVKHCRNKESNMKAHCKDVLKRIYNNSREAKTVRGLTSLSSHSRLPV